jgi:hypothetical protein
MSPEFARRARLFGLNLLQLRDENVAEISKSGVENLENERRVGAGRF